MPCASASCDGEFQHAALVGEGAGRECEFGAARLAAGRPAAARQTDGRRVRTTAGCMRQPRVAAGVPPPARCAVPRWGWKVLGLGPRALQLAVDRVLNGSVSDAQVMCRMWRVKVRS